MRPNINIVLFIKKLYIKTIAFDKYVARHPLLGKRYTRVIYLIFILINKRVIF